MGGNLISSILRQFLSNSYKDSESSTYKTKVIFLIVTILLALSHAIQDFFRVEHILIQ